MSLSAFLCLCISLSLCLSLCLIVCQTVCICLSLSVSLSLSQYLSFSLSLSVLFSFSLSLARALALSLPLVFLYFDISYILAYLHVCTYVCVGNAFICALERDCMCTDKYPQADPASKRENPCTDRSGRRPSTSPYCRRTRRMAGRCRRHMATPRTNRRRTSCRIAQRCNL